MFRLVNLLLFSHNSIRGIPVYGNTTYFFFIYFSYIIFFSIDFFVFHFFFLQYYVIKFVIDLRQVGGFLRVLRFPPPIKLTATM
jgi:hypothetical protein